MRHLSSAASPLWLLTAFLLAPAGLQAQTPPPSAGPTVQSATALLGQGDFAGAATALESITRAQPQNAQAWNLLGFAYRSLQRTDEAIVAYRTAIRLPNAPPTSTLNLGLLLATNGQDDEGFELLTRLKEAGTFDITQIDTQPAAAALRSDPRYRALFPTPAAFADPFVEPVHILKEWRGEAVGDQFGWIARNVGDVDGDGVNDVTTSAPSHATGGAGAGRIYVYSGRTGALLWFADGEAGDQLGLGINPAGDVDGDGIPDIVAGAPGGEKVTVYHGRTGDVLLTASGTEAGERFGHRVIGLGDVDGDGASELLVGAPASTAQGAGTGRAYVVSGRTGEILLTVTGEQAGDGFGSAVGGKVADDGRVTLVVGAPNAGEGDRGATYVYHSLSETADFVIQSDEQGSQLGAMFVSAVGDVDADGVLDVYAADYSANSNGQGSGRAFVHSGATGERLFDLAGDGPGYGFGIGIADAGDLDRDGYDDLAIGAWQDRTVAFAGGSVVLYSGRDGRRLRKITGKVMGETLGFDVTGMGDVDGDGVPDLLVTSAWSAVNGGRSGRMFILSGTSGG